jgi:hypothetical protein
MISFELATELKEAGFPQAGNGRWIGPPDQVLWRGGDRVYVPTVGELIEACGVRFDILKRHTDGWSAQGYGHTVIPVLRCATPTEALARLWLALYGDASA